jgi:hypothetical protein
LDETAPDTIDKKYCHGAGKWGEEPRCANVDESVFEVEAQRFRGLIRLGGSEPLDGLSDSDEQYVKEDATTAAYALLCRDFDLTHRRIIVVRSENRYGDQRLLWLPVSSKKGKQKLIE